MSTESVMKKRKAKSKESSGELPTCSSSEVACSRTTESGDGARQTETTTSAPDLSKQDATLGDGIERKAEVPDGNLPEDLRCSICMDFFIEPTLTDCAHVFCNFCIHCWFENRGSSICPQCRNIVQQVFPSPDLNDKVEKYVLANLSPELLEERERTKRSRRQDMNFIAQDLPMTNNPDATFSNSTSDIDELFWTVTMQQEELPDFSFWPTSIPGYTVFSNSLADSRPPTRPQPLEETSADEVDEALQQFEYRLDRAQRAYGVLVSAQREMNHQLEHLHSISHRLERHDRLSNHVSSLSASATSTAHDLGLLDNLEPRNTNEFRLAVDETLQDVSSSAVPHHSYATAEPEMWQWMSCPNMTPCSHCYLSGNGRCHGGHCAESSRYQNLGWYEHRGACFGSPRYIPPTQMNQTCSSSYHDQCPSSSSSSSYQQSLHPTTIPDRPRPARRRRHPESYQPLSYSSPTATTTTVPSLEEEYLEEMRHQIADNEFAEAIERSLVMDMFEPHFDGHQQISVRSSRVLGPTSQNITSISIETDFLSDLNGHQSNCQRCPPREVPAARRQRHSNPGSRHR